MLKNKFLQILLLLYINNIKYIFNKIVLPIDNLPRENFLELYDINSPQDIIDQRNRNILITTFEIGSPLQKVPLIIKANKNYYVITSINPVENKTNDYKTFNFSVDFFKEYDFYNETKSKTSVINWCRESEYYSAEECCSVNDTINFYEDINMKKKMTKNIKFEMMRNVQDNITGEIGLNIYDEVGRIYNTFLGILKTNKLIKNYYWYFDYDSWDNPKGSLVIGSLPHEDYPNLYSENDLCFTKSNQLFRTSYMEMKFDKIYIKNGSLTINFNVNVELRYDTKIIIGDYQYENYLKSKIDYLIKDGKCINDFVRDFEFCQNMTFYYCKNEAEIKRKLNEIITPIYFYSKDFNKTFEIKNNEILLEKDGYIYIQILFHNIVKKWSLGTIFTLKNKFVFNQDKQQIGVYTKLKGEESKNYSSMIKVGLLIVLAIILVFLGIIIGKILFKSRKKRANELSDDDYEYSLNDNASDKCNINNDSI